MILNDFIAKLPIEKIIKTEILEKLAKQDIGIQLVNITIQDSEPPTEEVMAAIKTNKKKKTPIIFPAGIIEKTKGRVSKTRVGPEVGSIP